MNLGKKQDMEGFSEENVNNLFLLSVISAMIAYQCKLLPSLDYYRSEIVKQIKKTILGTKMRDFQFQLSTTNYYDFFNKFLRSEVSMDNNFYFIEALSNIIHRPIFVILSLKRHKNVVFKFKEELDKPPIILGLVERNNHEIFLPYIQSKNQRLTLESVG